MLLLIIFVRYIHFIIYFVCKNPFKTQQDSISSYFVEPLNNIKENNIESNQSETSDLRKTSERICLGKRQVHELDLDVLPLITTGSKTENSEILFNYFFAGEEHFAGSEDHQISRVVFSSFQKWEDKNCVTHRDLPLASHPVEYKSEALPTSVESSVEYTVVESIAVPSVNWNKPVQVVKARQRLGNCQHFSAEPTFSNQTTGSKHCNKEINISDLFVKESHQIGLNSPIAVKVAKTEYCKESVRDNVNANMENKESNYEDQVGTYSDDGREISSSPVQSDHDAANENAEKCGENSNKDGSTFNELEDVVDQYKDTIKVGEDNENYEDENGSMTEEGHEADTENKSDLSDKNEELEDNGSIQDDENQEDDEEDNGSVNDKISHNNADPAASNSSEHLNIHPPLPAPPPPPPPPTPSISQVFSLPILSKASRNSTASKSPTVEPSVHSLSHSVSASSLKTVSNSNHSENARLVMASLTEKLASRKSAIDSLDQSNTSPSHCDLKNGSSGVDKATPSASSLVSTSSSSSAAAAAPSPINILQLSHAISALKENNQNKSTSLPSSSSVPKPTAKQHSNVNGFALRSMASNDGDHAATKDQLITELKETALDGSTLKRSKKPQEGGQMTMIYSYGNDNSARRPSLEDPSNNSEPSKPKAKSVEPKVNGRRGSPAAEDDDDPALNIVIQPLVEKPGSRIHSLGSHKPHVNGSEEPKVVKTEPPTQTNAKPMTQVKTQNGSSKEIADITDMKYYMDKVPRDVPEWRRQMLARQLADKAKKDLEEQKRKEEEQNKYRHLPTWKRHLMQRKDAEAKAAAEKEKEKQLRNEKQVHRHRKVASPLCETTSPTGEMAPWQLEVTLKKPTA